MLKHSNGMNGVKVKRKKGSFRVVWAEVLLRTSNVVISRIVSLGMSNKYVKMKKRTRGTCSNVCFLSLRVDVRKNRTTGGKP